VDSKRSGSRARKLPRCGAADVLPSSSPENTMSILGTLFSKILGHKAAAPTPSAGPTMNKTGAASSATPAPAPPAAPAGAGGRPAPSAPAAQAIPRLDDVDLQQLLDEAVKKSGQKLDWRHSIVDLMKSVGMESSLAERKELAKELGYTGDTSDSAKMNVWLHAEVLKRIAANGGKVPESMKD
jgi:3-oxoacyl-ACP reductase-like protein